MTLSSANKARVLRMASSGWPPATMNRLLPPCRRMRQRKTIIENFLRRHGIEYRHQPKNRGGQRE